MINRQKVNPVVVKSVCVSNKDDVMRLCLHPAEIFVGSGSSDARCSWARDPTLRRRSHCVDSGGVQLQQNTFSPGMNR